MFWEETAFHLRNAARQKFLPDVFCGCRDAYNDGEGESTTLNGREEKIDKKWKNDIIGLGL